MKGFMTIHEIGGLQGFSKEHVDIYLQATSATKLGQGFGDAMSLNLLIRILAVALPACGLATKQLKDPWLSVPSCGTLPGAVYKQSHVSVKQKPAAKQAVWS